MLTLIRATPRWRSQRCPARILVVRRLWVNPDATSMALPRPAATLVSFATEHVPESARVAMWEEHNTASLVGLTCQVPQRPAFRAREVNLALPRLQLASVTASPHAVKRNRRQVADTPAGSLAVYFAVTGEALLSSGDRACTVRPGQVLIVDADRPFVRSFAHGLRELAVTVPYEAIDLDTGSSGFPQVVGPGGAVVARALAALVQRSLRQPPPDPEHVEHEVLMMLTFIISGSVSNPLALQFLLAAELVRRRLADQSLSAAQVAAGVGVSERQLSRAFAHHGESYAHFVLRERLELAHTRLTAAAPDTSIAEISRCCGFTAAAHFTRAFSALYGCPPRDVRDRS